MTMKKVCLPSERARTFVESQLENGLSVSKTFYDRNRCQLRYSVVGSGNIDLLSDWDLSTGGCPYVLGTSNWLHAKILDRTKNHDEVFLIEDSFARPNDFSELKGAIPRLIYENKEVYYLLTGKLGTLDNISKLLKYTGGANSSIGMMLSEVNLYPLYGDMVASPPIISNFASAVYQLYVGAFDGEGLLIADFD